MHKKRLDIRKLCVENYIIFYRINEVMERIEVIYL